MTNNPNELTIENSALVLIDHQPAVGLAVHSIDQGLLVTNVASLAKAAKALGVPTVLTTIGARGSVLVDPIFKEISDAFPEITPIDRTTTHAWSDPNFRAAVDATGRKKLIMAGIVTGTCLSQSVLARVRGLLRQRLLRRCVERGTRRRQGPHDAGRGEADHLVEPHRSVGPGLQVAATSRPGQHLLAAYWHCGPHDRVRDRPSHSRYRAGTRLPVSSCSSRGSVISVC